MRARESALLFTLAGLMVGAVVHPQRVTIEAENAPLEEVLRELRAQTGFGFPVSGKAAAGTETVTVSLDDVDLKRAVQEICRQTGCTFTRVGDTYILGPAGPETEYVATAVAGDYVVGVSPLEIASRRRRHIGGPCSEAPSTEGYPRLAIRLHIDAPDDASGLRILGIHSGLTLVDDKGRGMARAPDEAPVTTEFPGSSRVRVDESGQKLVEGGPPLLLPRPSNDPSSLSWHLDAPPPRPDAISLTMSGNLLLLTECQQVEMSVPWGDVGATRAVGGAELTAQAFYKPWDGRFKATFIVDRALVALPPGYEGAPRFAPSLYSWVVWEDGERTMRGTCSGGIYERGRLGDGHDISEISWEFRYPKRAGERPKELGVRTFIRAGPPVELPFVVRDIPLPEGRPEPVFSTPEPKDRGPYWADQPEAGSVAFDVRVGNRPVPGPLPIEILARPVKSDGSDNVLWLWYTIIDRNGRVVLGNLKPGHYGLTLKGFSIGGAGRPEAEQHLRDGYGLEPESYVWINDYARVDVKAGEEIELPPLCFVPRMQNARPASGDVLPADAVWFEWEAFPEATSYVLSLGANPKSSEGHIFWVSGPITETHLRYDPAAGYVQGDEDRQYLKLGPEFGYYWWVSALNAEGETIARASGRFQVE